MTFGLIVLAVVVGNIIDSVLQTLVTRVIYGVWGVHVLDSRSPQDYSRTMSDDPSKRGQADRDRVNVNQEHEVRYWASKWGCTEDELRAAVEAVGVMVSDVARFLGKST